MTGFLDDWTAWREAREARLRDPHGWLAITAIHWLALRPERLDAVPGTWCHDGRGVVVVLDQGESLTLGADVLGAGTHVLGSVDEAGVRLAFGEPELGVLEVAARDGRVIVRPRRPDSPLLRSYRSTPSYAPDPRWAVPARFEEYAEPDGEAVGEVTFAYAGAEHRLVAWHDPDGLWILFRDATSGVTTYPANRQLVTEPPAPDGRVTLDFNRAFNMPCAYTDFATCPLPPPGNTLPFAVEAGEQLPDLGVDPR